MTGQEAIMIGVYDHRLVTLSVLISISGSYAARDLFERVSKSHGRNRFIWLACGATADGIGTWSMHYTGMMALSLSVSVLYHWPTVVLSLLVGIVGSSAAMLILASTRFGWVRIVAASICLGVVAISSLHYIAMASMRLQAMHHYSPALVTLSVVTVILICLLAIWVAFLFRKGDRLRYHGSVWLRGAANPTMHYIAMASITFTYSVTTPNLERAVNVYSLGIAGISVVPVMLLFVVLLTSAAARDRNQRALLDELFEQAPQAVVLMSVENRVIRVNREFTRFFGYTAQEAQGQLIRDLIIPDDSKDEDRTLSELVAHGKRVEAESVRHRKDGSHLHASIVRVPVSLPDKQIATYGIYRDI